jgi:hypothetical protein
MSNRERGKQAPWTRMRIEPEDKISRPLRGYETSPGFQHYFEQHPLCTTLAAVINSALDRNVFKVLNLPDKKNFFGEDFHKRKIFVLLCRTDPAY